MRRHLHFLLIAVLFSTLPLNGVRAQAFSEQAEEDAVEPEEGIRIKSATTHLNGTRYMLDADVEYVLPAQALEALDNGVTLTFVVQTQAVEVRDWLWASTIRSNELRFRIVYHALSDTYRLTNVNQGTQRNYWWLKSALADMGRIREFAVVDQDDLTRGVGYKFRMKTFLDIEALPLPLRSVAYMSSAWHIGTDWYTWDPEL